MISKARIIILIVLGVILLMMLSLLWYLQPSYPAPVQRGVILNNYIDNLPEYKYPDRMMSAVEHDHKKLLQEMGKQMDPGIHKKIFEYVRGPIPACELCNGQIADQQDAYRHVYQNFFDNAMQAHATSCLGGVDCKTCQRLEEQGFFKPRCGAWMHWSCLRKYTDNGKNWYYTRCPKCNKKFTGDRSERLNPPE